MKKRAILSFCFGILLLAGAKTSGQNPPSRPNFKEPTEGSYHLSPGVQVKIIFTYDEAGNRISRTYTTEYVIDPGLITPVAIDSTNTFNFEDPNLNFPVNPTPSPTPTPKPERPRP